MGFGIQSAGDFTPVVKYNAKAGRFFREDRGDGGKQEVDISSTFKAVFDFENVEVGWLHFVTGGAPSFVMAPLGSPIPPRPSPDHKQGVRFLLKLAPSCGGDVREIASAAGAFIGVVSDLHDVYLAQKDANAGKLPVVVAREPVITGSGDKRNYKPTLEIVGWAPRPADMAASPRGAAAVAPKPAAPVSAPVAAKPVAAASEDDFGD